MGPFTDLLVRHFPEEQSLIGYRPEEIGRLVDRALSRKYRLFLGFLRALGVPVFRFFVIESEGRVAATALVTFASRAGFISSVVVDTPFRGRGYAKSLLAACHRAARRAHKPFTVLDVDRKNVAAQTLYRELGYQPLREQVIVTRPVGTADARPAFDATPSLRRFRPSDGGPLAEMGNQAMSDGERGALLYSARQFRIPPRLQGLFGAETEAWVLLANARPVGFLRATVSSLTEAGNFTAPLLAPGVEVSAARPLLEEAIAWMGHRQSPKIVCEVPTADARLLPLLGSFGFRGEHRIDTLVRPTAG